MYPITLQPQLMEQLEQVASEQAVRPEELVESAVRAYLRQIEREKIKGAARRVDRDAPGPVRCHPQREGS